MTTQPYHEVPGLGGVYLEDSYVLGIDEDERALTFRLDVVLTEQHPEYRRPGPDEQYCYRPGTLTFTGFREVHWSERTGATTVDPDGSTDHGNIDTFIQHGDDYELSGEWGRLTVHGGHPSLTLDPTRP